jgi:uncharacterized protein YrrD
MTGVKGMRRASDLLGLPVIDANKRPLGKVVEVLVDLDREILGALLFADKIRGESGLLTVEDVVFAPESIIVPADAIICGDGAVILRQGKLTLEQARKLSVETCSGNRIGNVADLIIDGNQLVALELSDGLLQDVFEGRSVLPLPRDIGLAGEKLIVPDETGLKTYDSGSDGSSAGDIEYGG